MKKKILPVLMTVSMVATILAGCGSAAAGTESVAPAPAQAETQEASQPAEDPEDEEPFDDEEV